MTIIDIEPKFKLGQIVATPGALEVLERTGTSPLSLLVRHVSGDWGTVPSEDALANQWALEHDARLLSSYGEGDDTLWLITEADRAVTTILRPEDY